MCRLKYSRQCGLPHAELVGYSVARGLVVFVPSPCYGDVVMRQLKGVVPFSCLWDVIVAMVILYAVLPKYICGLRVLTCDVGGYSG